jgi:hypothetical protein
MQPGSLDLLVARVPRTELLHYSSSHQAYILPYLSPTPFYAASMQQLTLNLCVSTPTHRKRIRQEHIAAHMAACPGSNNGCKARPMSYSCKHPSLHAACIWARSAHVQGLFIHALPPQLLCCAVVAYHYVACRKHGGDAGMVTVGEFPS